MLCVADNKIKNLKNTEKFRVFLFRQRNMTFFAHAVCYNIIKLNIQKGNSNESGKRQKTGL